MLPITIQDPFFKSDIIWSIDARAIVDERKASGDLEEYSAVEAGQLILIGCIHQFTEHWN